MLCYRTVKAEPEPASDGDSQASALIAELKRDVRVYKDKCEGLREDMYWFQKSAGFDFIPEKTKVNHYHIILSWNKYVSSPHFVLFCLGCTHSCLCLCMILYDVLLFRCCISRVTHLS
jgi:hypothetical protein